MTNYKTPRRGLDHPGVIIVLVIVGVCSLIAGVIWHEPLMRLVGRGDSKSGQQVSPPGSQTKQLWTCGMHPQVIREVPGLCPICEMELTPVQSGGSSTGTASSGERKVKYWWDPMMSPPYVSQEPGKSPMGMDLIPVYEDEIIAGPAVMIDPVVVQNMGVRIASVVEGPLRVSIRATGYLEEPEPNHLDINLRVAGWIQKLHANIDGMRINQGDPLFDLYSPALQVAMQELAAARKSMQNPNAAATAPSDIMRAAYDAARRKLELAGVDQAQIEEIEKADRVPDVVTFRSPMTGHLTEKKVYEGAAVEAGQLVLRLADNSTMWIDLRIFEHQLSLVKIGQNVKATVEAMPGKEFDGEVIFIHPHLDEMTRTALVRIAIPNSDLQLRQEMYATVRVESEVAERAILVPREAVIDTGERQVALVAVSGATFEPRRVMLGAAANDGMVQVVSGLAPGEAVVTSGQFLLDSESRMKEAIQKHLSANLLQPRSENGTMMAATQPETQPAAEIIAGAWTPEVDLAFVEPIPKPSKRHTRGIANRVKG
ncbi:MAG: efflux RND transporter periplasmic adaptor subunit [Phycisphaerales bacterium]|nr:efflux RND transporter periplasmic adaptor subunit [Phycisphaerales bacterium]